MRKLHPHDAKLLVSPMIVAHTKMDTKLTTFLAFYYDTLFQKLIHVSCPCCHLWIIINDALMSRMKNMHCKATSACEGVFINVSITFLTFFSPENVNQLQIEKYLPYAIPGKNWR